MTVASARIAVVTGGSSGIGLATVSSLLEAGHRVAFFGQDRCRVAAAEEKLAIRFGARAIFARKVDLSLASDVYSFFDALADFWAMPDILICNAGISPKGPNGPAPFAETALDEWNAVLSVNLTGTMLCCQAVLPAMLARDFGRIVIVGSIAGRTVPKIAGASYVASKSALAGVVRSLLSACRGKGITVNLVAPGRIATEMAGPPDSEANRAAITRIPVGRLGVPNDVASAIGFLVSDEAGFINGAVLDINGGEFAPL